ncbi:MAG TPA: hypothetical protein DEO65_11980 [Bacillus bacterium]|uniref:Secreted protein n=1 Tax=Siminovitchia fordii TaxID=254759 RepID=A0ABQ4K6W5_9BACI|nr:hypothetical protein [Siminovitchia fordii]GIN21356.1 hypothetical protein J1TS3_24900 [Siminovitchia fordii]HBZ10584.1 hypothetical protein [Bacillus sp. (in: firmicutes)]
MLSIIRNHSFIVIFFIFSTMMGLFFIFNLTEEEQPPKTLTGNQQNMYVEQTQNSQGLITKGEQVLD